MCWNLIGYHCDHQLQCCFRLLSFWFQFQCMGLGPGQLYDRCWKHFSNECDVHHFQLDTMTNIRLEYLLPTESSRLVRHSQRHRTNIQFQDIRNQNVVEWQEGEAVIPSNIFHSM